MKPKTLPDGRVIVDERCSCGSPRSEHVGRYGPNAATGCERFMWASLIFADGGPCAGCEVAMFERSLCDACDAAEPQT